MADDREQTYRIGEVAARTMLSRDTLRYYERLGLLDRQPRTGGGFRLYGEATLDRLRFIKRAQAVGFTLEEIRELVSFDGRGLKRCGRVRDLVATKLAELDAQLSELRAFRRSLVGSLQKCSVALAGQRDVECPVVETGVVPVPHPVLWTQVNATPPGVARAPRGPRSACDTRASRAARSCCTAPRTRSLRRVPP